MIQIHRSLHDNNKLICQVIINKSVGAVDLSTFKSEQERADTVGFMAQTLGGSRSETIAEYKRAIKKLTRLSQARKRRILSISMPDECKADLEFIYKTLISDSLVTFYEIYWLDWYLHKHNIRYMQEPEN